MGADEVIVRGDAAGPAHQLPANYEYWREHGNDWVAEYVTRKQRHVLYHIQELMLTDYVLRHAESVAQPFAVLDYGCGVGRHLRNVSRLSNVECFGFDQSATMAAGCLRWTSREWFDAHVRTGEPVGTLPFPDGRFDLVYTTEVLVHVRPEDLDAILAELVRVCRGHILHLEPAPGVALLPDAHEGCWAHDLPAAYARLGLRVDMVAPGYTVHAPYRVVIRETPRFTWHPAILELYRGLEAAIDGTLATLDHRIRLLETHLVEAQSARRTPHAAVAEGEQHAGQPEEERLSLARRIETLEQALATAEQERIAAAAEAARLVEANAAALREVQAAREWIATAEHREARLRGTLAQQAARVSHLIAERRSFVAEASRLLKV